MERPHSQCNFSLQHEYKQKLNALASTLNVTKVALIIHWIDMSIEELDEGLREIFNMKYRQ